MSTPRFGRMQKASALVPLALLSAAWTASIAGVGATEAASADENPSQILPDGTFGFPLVGQMTAAGQLPADLATRPERPPPSDRALAGLYRHGHRRLVASALVAAGLPLAGLLRPIALIGRHIDQRADALAPPQPPRPLRMHLQAPFLSSKTADTAA